MRFSETRGIYRRGNVYWLAFQAAGKRSFVSLETGDLRTAITRAEEIRRVPELDGSTLAGALSVFLSEKRMSRACRDNARTALGRLCRQMPRSALVGRVTAADARAYVMGMDGLSDATVRTYTALCHLFFAWCVRTERCRRNPFAAMDLPRQTPAARRDFCTAAERDQLINECARDDITFVLYCGFHAGMRRNEIVNARPGWFDLERKMIHIRKVPAALADETGLDKFDLKDREERGLPMTSEFAAFLSARPGLMSGDYCIGKGKRLGRGRYRYDPRRPFERHTAEAGMPWVTFHTMRRTFCSLLVSSGVSPYIVAQWIGDDVRVFQRHYGHLLPCHAEIERAF